MYSGFDDWKSRSAKFGDKKPPEKVISQLETLFLHDKVFEILENEEIDEVFKDWGVRAMLPKIDQRSF